MHNRSAAKQSSAIAAELTIAFVAKQSLVLATPDRFYVAIALARPSAVLTPKRSPA